MNIRAIDIVKDKQTLIDFHCVINYESGSPILRKTYTFERFREIWMSSHGPDEFLSDLSASMKDRRTIAEFWEDGRSIVAYVWVTFTDWPEYNATGAEIKDIMVAPEFQRRGIATQVIKHVEELARERGATELRSGTGIQNAASRELHTKLGFYTQRIEFEKEL
jgi:GNAT superfamily N-acetyltransferase